MILEMVKKSRPSLMLRYSIYHHAGKVSVTEGQWVMPSLYTLPASYLNLPPSHFALYPITLSSSSHSVCQKAYHSISFFSLCLIFMPLLLFHPTQFARHPTTPPPPCLLSCWVPSFLPPPDRVASSPSLLHDSLSTSRTKSLN